MARIGYARAEAPRVVKSTPADGAKEVPVDVGKIVIVFDRNMKMNSWSLLEVQDHPFPPMVPEEDPWSDPVTFVLPIKTLQPNTTYALQLNSEKKKGFLSAEDQVPLPVTVLTFTTAGAGTGGSTVADGADAAETAGAPTEDGTANPLVGTWMFRSPELTMVVEFRPEGRFSQTIQTPEGTEKNEGRYEVQPNLIVAHVDGTGETLQIHYKLLKDNQELQITDEEGHGLQLVRQAGTPPGKTPQVSPPTPGPGLQVPGGGAGLPPAGLAPLVPPLPLPASPAGHIIFTRAVLTRVTVPGFNETIPLLKLFVMNGDGSEQRPFLAPEDFTNVKEARWSPGYDRLAFSSDWKQELSACVHDVFVAPAAGGPAVRITGNELRGPAPQGYGTVTGLIRDNTKSQNWNIDRPASAINITAQGAGSIVHPGDLQDIALLNPETQQKIKEEAMRGFIIPKVAAGPKVWVKIWVTRNMGHLVFTGVRPGEVTDIGAVEVNDCNYAASKPSLTPDGRYGVGMGHLLSIDPNAQTPLTGADGQPIGAETGQLGGAEAITVWDLANGMPVATLDPMKVQALSAKDPAVSPDGRFIACGLGQPTLEDLALIGLEDLLNNQPQPRVLVPGERIWPSEMTMFKTANISAATPAWSPDGRQIAFCRFVLAENVSGNLWIVNVDGSGLRQLTNGAPNQLVCQPCFSPDGRRIAFTVLTGKFSPFKIEHLLTLQFTADVYSINVDGSDPQQLTTDGLSSEPAWGP
jgi:hypothetical protein